MGKGLDWGGIFFFKNLIQNGGGRGCSGEERMRDFAFVWTWDVGCLDS